MKFHIGIEAPKNDGTAFGIIVPVFTRMNLDCASAADTRDEIKEQATYAIQMMVASMLRDGGKLEDLEDRDEALVTYKVENEDHTEWQTIDVDMESAIAQSKVTQEQIDEAYRQTKEAWDTMLAESGQSQTMFIATNKDAIQFLGQYEMIRQDVIEMGFEAPPLVGGVQVNLGGVVEDDEEVA